MNMNNPAVAAFSPLSLVSTVASLGVLVCFILVVVQMFQRGDKTGGIISIVSLLICCLGLLLNVNFVMGWMKADRWNMKKLMYIYTGFFVVYLLATVLTIPQQIAMFQQQMKAIQEQQQQQPGMPGAAPAPIPAPGQPAGDMPEPAPQPAPEPSPAPGL